MYPASLQLLVKRLFFTVIILATASYCISQGKLQLTVVEPNPETSENLVLKTRQFDMKLVVSGAGANELQYFVIMNGQDLPLITPSITKTIGPLRQVDIEVNVPTEIQAGKVDLSIMALTEDGSLLSDSTLVNFEYQPSTDVRSSQQTKPERNLRILAVGVDKYNDEKFEPLNYAAKDAQDFSDALTGQENTIYDSVSVNVLSNEKALLSEVQSELNTLVEQSGPNDTTIVFFAGHGINRANQNYFLPFHDAKSSDIEKTSLAKQELVDFIKNSNGRVLLFIDTCHSGAIVDVRNADLSDPVNLLDSLETAVNSSGGEKVVIAASKGGEFAHENSDWENGAFTEAIVEAFENGHGTDATGTMSVLGLATWVSSRVQQLTYNEQTPTLRFNGSDFAIATRNVILEADDTPLDETQTELATPTVQSVENVEPVNVEASESSFERIETPITSVVETATEITQEASCLDDNYIAKNSSSPIDINYESAHPYADNYTDSWSITNSSGEGASRIHFSRIDIEEGVDFIQILDQYDSIVQTITTNAPQGVWSKPVVGALAKIVLTTDRSSQCENCEKYWGFAVDKIQPIKYEAIEDSFHMYAVNTTQEISILNDTPNQNATAVVFGCIDLAEDGDSIVLRDIEGRVHQIIEEDKLSGFTSNAIPGPGIQIDLVSDATQTSWGYNVIDILGFPEPYEPETLVRQEVSVETNHPYQTSSDNTWEIENPDSSAGSTKIHFSRLELSEDHLLQILDSNNLVIQTFINNQNDLIMSDFWSDSVPGTLVKVRLKSGSRSQWGFKIDAVATSDEKPVLAQSNHPYLTSNTNTWTIVNPDPSAKSSKIRFSRLDLGEDHKIEILDSDDVVIQTIIDTSRNIFVRDFWSDYIPGRVIKIRMTTGSYAQWGFRVDAIETSLTSPVLAQSNHPYKTSDVNTWNVVNPDPSAKSSKIRFSRLDLGEDHKIEILDSDDVVIQTIMNTSSNISARDFWSDYVPGRVVKIRMTTGSYAQWGFRVDAIATSVTNPGLAQSNHPYKPNSENTWNIVNSDAAAQYSRIRFSKLDLAEDHTIEILDSNDVVVQTIVNTSTNIVTEDFWTDFVPGRVVKVRMKTGSYPRWGFRVDRIESNE